MKQINRHNPAAGVGGMQRTAILKDNNAML